MSENQRTRTIFSGYRPNDCFSPNEENNRIDRVVYIVYTQVLYYMTLRKWLIISKWGGASSDRFVSVDGQISGFSSDGFVGVGGQSG